MCQGWGQPRPTITIFRNKNSQRGLGKVRSKEARSKNLKRGGKCRKGRRMGSSRRRKRRGGDCKGKGKFRLVCLNNPNPAQLS